MAKHGTPIRERFNDHSKGLAHWVARKLNNHHPMRTHVDVSVRAKGYALGFVEGTDDKTVIYALPDGRRFAITVEEIEVEREVRTTEFVHV